MYNKYIDHTLLKAFATNEEIKKLCAEAKEHNFKSVCVNPYYIPLAKRELANSDVLVCTVIGFPLGANSIDTKVNETIDAIKNGADEIDMVINISRAKDHDFDYLEKEIFAVVNAANEKTVKVIIETCYLTDEEKIEACKAATRARANFVKTSTGFGTGGATLEDVRLMKANIASDMEVKASGGVKNHKQLVEFIEAGATRIGTSSGIQLIKGDKNVDTTY